MLTLNLFSSYCSSAPDMESLVVKSLSKFLAASFNSFRTTSLCLFPIFTLAHGLDIRICSFPEKLHFWCWTWASLMGPCYLFLNFMTVDSDFKGFQLEFSMSWISDWFSTYYFPAPLSVVQNVLPTCLNCLRNISGGPICIPYTMLSFPLVGEKGNWIGII